MSKSDDKTPGCKEYNQVSRRSFLGWTAGAIAAASTPGWLPKVVYAETENSSRDVLVSLFLRGGTDALSLCPPHGEDAYYRLRPNLAIPRPDSGRTGAALDLDGFFGFAPAMAPLMEAYQAGDLLVVQAVGNSDPTRSHFDAMHSMEVGQPDPPASVFSGWLGRHLATTAPSMQDSVLRAVGVGFGLQRTLEGGPLTLPIDNLESFGFAGDPATVDARRVALEELYEHYTEPLKTAGETTFRTVDLLQAIDFAGYQPAGGATYGEDELGLAFKSTAALIKADVGVEAVAIDLGGWDTHDFQGPIDGGMAQLMGTLASTLASFHQDLQASDRTNVIVVGMSEFGRNAQENGSLGTDHGHGGLMMALGSPIDGGRVLSQWPGLEAGQLYDGQDLAITIDYRDILSEIVTHRLGNPDIRNVFPDSEYTPVEHGILR